jgi:hypothetical protein
MRGLRIGVVAALSLPLGGCFGGFFPPKPIPDWAMSAAPAPEMPGPHRAAHPGKRNRADSVSLIEPMDLEVKPFSPEWQAREDAFDRRLRRTMNICGGC